MNTRIRKRILSWFEAALSEVDPAKVTRSALSDFDPGNGRLVVLAIGKAAVPMAQAAEEILGEAISSGFIVTKAGQLTDEVDGFIGIEAAHPIPNEASLHAGELVLEAARELTSSDTVLTLISGGGSALLEHPVDGVSLMDLQVSTELLMYAGAGIYELNAVRKALSAIKGGGLRRAMGPARSVTLMLSDVLGNDLGVIASGPTMIEPINRQQAWQVLEDFRVHDRVPHSVRALLTSDAPPTEDIDTSRDICTIVADNNTLVSAVDQTAQAEGLETQLVWNNWSNDARELGHRMVADCRNAANDIDVLIGGGEATSIVHGSGSGGRNTETALAAAMQMTPNDEWTIASLASDGDDGNSGAAGAIVNAMTVDDRRLAESAMAESDSAGYLKKRRALVISGATGTNVNDVYIAVRNRIAGED